MDDPITSSSSHPVGAQQTAAHGRVYVAYHKPALMVTGLGLVPIQVGRVGASEHLAMIGDDTGAHISELNASHSELTAHYWIWKNDGVADMVGLMHYRRLLELKRRARLPRFSEIYDLNFDPTRYAQELGKFLDAPDCDILAPAPTQLCQSLRGQYARLHHAADLNLLEETIARYHPDFLPDLQNALAGRSLRIGNMFIMRRDIFNDYSALLFDVLDRVHAQIAASNSTRPAYQARYAGFLVERMLTAYLGGQMIRQRHPGLRIRDTAILNIDRGLVAQAGLVQRLKWAWRGQLPLGARDILKRVWLRV